MTRPVLHLIRLAFAAALLYVLAFASQGSSLHPLAWVLFVLAVGFELAFWKVAVLGRSRGHVKVDDDADER